jgi:hypothetical protein
MTSLLLLAVASQQFGPVALFDGKSLKGWHEDVPSNDGKDVPVPAFIVREGVLVSLGEPRGHLISDAQFENYKLTVEYRWTKTPGNSGVLVHSSIPRARNNMLPRCLEVQLMSGNAGDFYMLGETIKKRGATEPVSGIRIPNTTDNSEKPAGEWNTMVVECLGNTVKVWVNGDFVNDGVECSATRGQIAIQSEGAEIEFRKIEILKIQPGG